MQIKLSKPTFASEWTLASLGIVVPFWLVILANWMIAYAPRLMGQVVEFLDAVAPTQETQPFVYRYILVPLNAQDGAWFVVVGILMMILALVLTVVTFYKGGFAQMELGKMRLFPFVVVAMASLIVAMLFVALMNSAMFDTLTALQNAA